MADEKVLAHWPHNSSILQNLAGDYANLGREKEAIDLTNRKPEIHFNYYDYANLGYAYFALGDFPSAERYFQKARAFYLHGDLRNNISAAQNEAYLASTLAHLGRISDAKNVLQRIADVPSVASISAVVASLGKRLPPATDVLQEGLGKAGYPQ
jgi:tetratricopeptide (TPR) repeat protein